MKETKVYRLVIGCLVSHKYEQEIQLSDLDMLCTNLLESKEKQMVPLRLDPRETFLINSVVHTWLVIIRKNNQPACLQRPLVHWKNMDYSL